MNWYLAKIVYRIICGEGRHTPQFDEQLRLIQADNEKEAWQKAMTIGTNEEEIFVNENKTMVQWKFINVAELFHIADFMDGAELYSRIEEPESAENYITLINKKGENIRNDVGAKVIDIS